MINDPVWNSFVNSGNVNDYLAYKKKKNNKVKNVSEMDSNGSGLNRGQ